MNNATLALDLGCHCGFAIRDSSGRVHSARWDLPQPASGDTWFDLWLHLEDSHTAHGFALVVFEEIVFSLPGRTRASMILGGFRAIVEMWCRSRNVPLRGYNVKAIKKSATGKGNADKAMMRQFAAIHFSEQTIRSDDEADALCLLYTHENFVDFGKRIGVG